MLPVAHFPRKRGWQLYSRGESESSPAVSPILPRPPAAMGAHAGPRHWTGGHLCSLLSPVPLGPPHWLGRGVAGWMV